MKELINKIKQKGYWKVIIHPAIFKETNILSVEDCKNIIESSVVSLRGWNYPHIDRGGIKISGNDSIESFCDWESGGYYEYWRFYKSGQFVHYFSMREDYRIDDKKLKQIQQNNDTESTCFLSILSTLYSVTEIYEFAQRLAAKNALGQSAEIVIELGNVEGRKLFFWDSFSRWLSSNYICAFKDEDIAVKRIATQEELISNANKVALGVCIEIFNKFNWVQAPKEVFAKDQEKFLKRLL